MIKRVLCIFVVGLSFAPAVLAGQKSPLLTSNSLADVQAGGHIEGAIVDTSRVHCGADSEKIVARSASDSAVQSVGSARSAR